MNRLPSLTAVLLFMLTVHAWSAPLDELVSPVQGIRDKAAAGLRATYQSTPQNKWQAVIDPIQAGQSKTDILKLLEPFHVTPEMGNGSGQSHSESYRLDDGWMLTCWYKNNGDILIGKKLVQSTRYIWVAPAKDFTGKWITYFVNGQKSYEIDYKDGQYFGEFAAHHANGNRCYVQHYDETGANGEDTGYHPSGHVAYKGRYKAGKQVGKWIWYDDEGNMASSREEAGIYQYNVTFSPDKSKPPHGILFCNGSSLSVAFERVVTPLGEFIGVQDGGAGDWQQIEKGLTLGEWKSAAVSTKSSLAGSHEHPPEGVGSDWFYVVKKGLWVNPKKRSDVNL